MPRRRIGFVCSEAVEKHQGGLKRFPNVAMNPVDFTAALAAPVKSLG